MIFYYDQSGVACGGFVSLSISQVWQLDLGSLSPRRTHDIKIGYIPILMLTLNVTASQVLMVPKIVGFSIPRWEPKPKPCAPWGQKCLPIDHPGHPQGSGKEHHPPVTRDCAGPRRTPVSSGHWENPARSAVHEKNLSPDDDAPLHAPPFYPRCICRPSLTDDVIHCWVFCCGGL